MNSPANLPAAHGLLALCLIGLGADVAHAEHSLPAVQVQHTRSVADSNQLPIVGSSGLCAAARAAQERRSGPNISRYHLVRAGSGNEASVTSHSRWMRQTSPGGSMCSWLGSAKAARI